MDNVKRLFFAFEIEAPWPEKVPGGRILSENARHMTVAFLGNIHYPDLTNIMAEFPPLPITVGSVGRFDKILFLPERHPHVVAWHIDWLEDQELLNNWQKDLIAWLQNFGFMPDARKELLPHVTLSRAPFEIKEWKKAFAPLPLLIKGLHLYESLGNLKYEPIWSYQNIRAPFEEVEHTADIAFKIIGTDLNQIYRHAFIALACKFPPLINFYSEKAPDSLTDIIMDLNDFLCEVDEKMGCPFKAISLHGDISHEESLLTWEMIVDV